MNVAMLSRWHVHADDYARQAMNHPDLTITAVWDEEPKRGKEWAESLNVSFFENLSELLRDDSIDAVIIDTPTNMHVEVILQAAAHKKHIFTEKVLAFTVDECQKIFDAAEENGVQLMLSLPRLTDPYYVYAQSAVDKGLIGTLTTIRCRLAHNGAVPLEGQESGWLPNYFFDPKLCGGGALIDLGAHPIYLTNRLGGQPQALYARLTSVLKKEVDDNSVVLVEYDSGALGIVEAGFVSSGSPFQLEIYGTEGTILVEENDVRIKSTHIDPDNWVKPELPSDIPSPMEEWVNMITKGEQPTIQREDMWRLTQLNEEAIRSNQEGKRIVLKR